MLSIFLFPVICPNEKTKYSISSFDWRVADLSSLHVFFLAPKIPIKYKP